MSASIIGLDLGTYSIKLVELRREGRSFAFLRAFQARIPQDPRVSREEAQSLVLEEQFQPEDLAHSQLVCAFPGNLTSIRILEMPSTERRQLDKMVPYEIENHIPGELEEIHFDWDLIETIEQGDKKMGRILAVSLYKEPFVKFLQALKMIQIDPREVTVDTLGLGFLLSRSEPQPPIALIDCGHTKTNICVVAGGKPIYGRAVGVAGREITRCLEKDFGLSFLEAETLKQTDGMLVTRAGPGVTADSERISKSIRRAVDELAAEVRQTLVTVEELYNLSIEEVHLFGGSARLKNFSPYLSSSLNMPVKRINYFTQMGIPDLADEDAYSLHGALSLALRGIENRPAQHINLRKGTFRGQKGLQMGALPVRQVASWGIFVLVFLLIHFVGKSIVLSAKLRNLDREIAKELKAVLPEYRYQDARQAVNVLKQKIRGDQPGTGPYEKIVQGQSPIILFGDLSQEIPKELPVTVTEIQIDSKSIIVEGTADSREAVGKMNQDLTHQPRFGKVSEDRVVKGEKGFDFKVTISIREAGET